MDRKTNLAPVRAQNRQAKTKLSSLRNKKAELERYKKIKGKAV